MSQDKQIDIEQLSWVPIPPQLEDGLDRQPLSKRKLRNWMLVLQAVDIPCRQEQLQHGWQLLVPTDRYRSAVKELSSYESINQNWPPPPPAEQPQQENTTLTLWLLIALGLFHILTHNNANLFGQTAINWHSLGNADAGRILAGEWWRLVTALTLHSGGVHLAGNVVIGGIFINRLCRDLGSGYGWSLVLFSGILGNLANAFVQSPAHRSIGASTAVFGAVGLLAVINMKRYRRQLRHRWPLPIAAALGVLALLGASGENTDIGAHLFGFLFGMLLGWQTGKSLARRPLPVQGNRLAATLSVGLLLLCWWAALQ